MTSKRKEATEGVQPAKKFKKGDSVATSKPPKQSGEKQKTKPQLGKKPSGTQLGKKPPGTQLGKKPPGTQLEKKTPGTQLERKTPGSQLERKTAGSQLERKTAGTQLERKTPGTQLERKTPGTQLERKTPGTQPGQKLSGTQLGKKPPGTQLGKKPFKKPLGDKKTPLPEKPEDWNKFKKEKKLLKLKRKQNRGAFDVIVEAKKLGELLRRKTLKGGEEQRNQIINDLHKLLKGKGHYAKFVLAHDTARIIQWLLKYSSNIVRDEISEEIVSVTVDMLQSKYGVHCVKRLLKHGTPKTKTAVVNAMYGHAVKLSSHAISAPIFEYAFTNCASQLQKIHLVQEFYGDIYKNSKDNNVKSIRDVFKDSPDLKTATLGATHANLQRVLNKSLLDSGLIQTVLYNYLNECSVEQRNELISQLVAHVVVLSNSKDGARVAMKCIWYGSNKDRKVIIKALKENLVDLCKHEHGHCTIITLLDSADDTVLLNKIILSEIVKNAKDLATNEWGRKVLLWCVAPADQTRFHPQFIKELDEGRTNSTSKKSSEIRRKEILTYTSSSLLNLVTEEPAYWLKNALMAYEMLAIVNAAIGDEVKFALEAIATTITDPEWKIKENDKEVLGVEEAGIHLALKKLAAHDKHRSDNKLPTLGGCLVEKLNNELLSSWIGINRACFFLVVVFENNNEEVQNKLKEKLTPHLKALKKQTTQGAKILVNKLKK